MNLTLLTDLYQINMMYAHFLNDKKDQIVVFDLFFRENPKGSGFAIAAGLEQVIDYIQDLSFSESDLDYLRGTFPYDERFLDELRNLTFTGEMYAVPEGTVMFPHEPMIRVQAPIFEGHLIETAMLNIVNHQTLIATKACRIKEAADKGAVMEFGLRRAQGPDAGLFGARAAFIGGVSSTSNLLAGKKFGIPTRGTHAHSYIQSYSTEREAFEAFARTFPENAILLVDTYNTLESGIPNAIDVFRQLKQELGDKFKNYGIRLDSGDLAYFSKEARRLMDEAGFPEASIVASSDLDEYLIRDLRAQGAQIDAWGVGTNLITSKDCPALGGVYKLAAETEDGQLKPKIKISENPEKITNPGAKKVVRFYEQTSGKALVDLIMLRDEPLPEGPFTAFHPVNTWKRKTVRNYIAIELLVPIFKNGEKLYECPSLVDIQTYSWHELQRFSSEIKRLVNPHIYHVDLSEDLWRLKNVLLSEARVQR